MFFRNLRKAGAQVGPLLGVQGLSGPPLTSLAKSPFVLFLCYDWSLGCIWFQVSYDHKSPAGDDSIGRPGDGFRDPSGEGPCSLPRSKVSQPRHVQPLKKSRDSPPTGSSTLWKSPYQLHRLSDCEPASLPEERRGRGRRPAGTGSRLLEWSQQRDKTMRTPAYCL